MLKVDRLFGPASPSKMEKLSGVMIILIIGGGVLTFVILFICAKRQIMRFAVRSRRGPHVPVGHDARKSLRKEIERRIDDIQKHIAYEPKMIHDDETRYILQSDETLPPYYYRMKAVDDIKILENEIAKQDGSVRHPRDSLRAFLLTTLAAPMNGTGQRLIHQFCDTYEHARHDPNEFGVDEYEAYRRLLLKLLDAAKMLKTYSGSRKTSPHRTPVKKQTKVHSLLDPSRLRPPPTTGNNPLGTNTRINYGLGMQQSQDSSESGRTQSTHNMTLPLEEDEIMSISTDAKIA